MSLCGTNNEQQLKIELLSPWKLEAESPKNLFLTQLRPLNLKIGLNRKANNRRKKMVAKRTLYEGFLHWKSSSEYICI